MSLKNLVTLFLVIVHFSTSALAKDFELRYLPHAERPMYDLATAANRISYYDYVRSVLGPKMQELAPHATFNNEAELAAGRGVSVKLSPYHYNVHVNFPNGPVGGRSYGWTQGRVGDWSDAMYLDRLEQVVTLHDDRDLAAFFELVIKMVGATDTAGIERLKPNTQSVATNFLAIYTAEAYRAMVPNAHMNWDDALLETTLLGAFHGGQKKLFKFYLGKFSDRSLKQGSGVYAKTHPGPKADSATVKKAQLRDYWQFSANPESKQSGINITRYDFEKMGAAITKYQRWVARNQTMERIFAVVGGDRNNVIKSISQFFTRGKSKDIAVINQLAKDVSAFLMTVHADADKMTEWILREEH